MHIIRITELKGNSKFNLVDPKCFPLNSRMHSSETKIQAEKALAALLVPGGGGRCFPGRIVENYLENADLDQLLHFLREKVEAQRGQIIL